MVAKAKLGPIKALDASFKVASPQLPISTEYCGEENIVIVATLEEEKRVSKEKRTLI